MGTKLEARSDDGVRKSDGGVGQVWWSHGRNKRDPREPPEPPEPPKPAEPQATPSINPARLTRVIVSGKSQKNHGAKAQETQFIRGESN